MSKGSKRRPCLVPREQFDQNWEAAFGTEESTRAAILEPWEEADGLRRACDFVERWLQRYHPTVIVHHDSACPTFVTWEKDAHNKKTATRRTWDYYSLQEPRPRTWTRPVYAGFIRNLRRWLRGLRLDEHCELLFPAYPQGNFKLPFSLRPTSIGIFYGVTRKCP